jgi:nitrogen fixation protein FixH
MGGILYLVYRSGQQRIDLVSKNYYEQELKFEKQIEKERKSLQLDEGLKINYEPSKNIVTVHYPATKSKSQLKGTVTFYKPDNAALDYTKPVDPGENNIQKIETSSMAPGLWKVQVNWDADSVSFYKEEKILVQNN